MAQPSTPAPPAGSRATLRDQIGDITPCGADGLNVPLNRTFTAPEFAPGRSWRGEVWRGTDGFPRFPAADPVHLVLSICGGRRAPGGVLTTDRVQPSAEVGALGRKLKDRGWSSGLDTEAKLTPPRRTGLG